MNNQYSLISKKEIFENPDKIGEMIATIGLAINKNKDKLEEIINRPFYKSLFCNRTNDLAKVVIDQNEIIQTYMQIIQQIIFLTGNNATLLLIIMNAIEKQENINTIKDNKYFSIAKEYIGEALKNAIKNKENEYMIRELKKENEINKNSIIFLQEKNRELAEIITEQNKNILELIKNTEGKLHKELEEINVSQYDDRLKKLENKQNIFIVIIVLLLITTITMSMGIYTL